MKRSLFLAMLMVTVGCATAPEPPVGAAAPCEVTEAVLAKVQTQTAG
jgi:hypothetical protein